MKLYDLGIVILIVAGVVLLAGMSSETVRSKFSNHQSDYNQTSLHNFNTQVVAKTTNTQATTNSWTNTFDKAK
jgi:hypothetical protein